MKGSKQKIRNWIDNSFLVYVGGINFSLFRNVVEGFKELFQLELESVGRPFLQLLEEIKFATLKKYDWLNFISQISNRLPTNWCYTIEIN